MPDEETFDVDAPLYGDVAEQTPPAEPAAPARTPAGDGDAAATPEGARVPPPDAKDSEPPKPDAAAPKASATEESELAKLRNDLALAKKDQAATARKMAAIEQERAALAEAKVLEQARIQQLIAEGRLTTEDVNAGPQLMDAWVQRRAQEAAEAHAAAEAAAAAAETDAARDAREAELYFKEQAIPLLAERVTLGLADSDVNPESLLRAALESPAIARIVAKTWDAWRPDDEKAELALDAMTQAQGVVREQMTALAAAKRATEEQKAARSQYDRTTAVGPATGGRETLPTFTTPEDDIRAYYERAR